MGLQLLGLPSEILILIFSFLSLPEINACKRSCQRLRAVIKQSGLLRCRIRTMKNCIEDLSPPGLSTAAFLDHLRKWEKAWLTFNVGNEAATQNTFRPYQGLFDFLLRSGYLIQLCQGDSPGWSYLDLSRQRGLHGQISAAQWTDIQLDTNFFAMGWALDIDQDFVATSRLSFETRGLEINFMHFTTGTRHESAAVPMILLDYEGNYEYSFGTHIEVMGCYLLVLVAHEALFRRYQTLYLLDWVQGRLVCVSNPQHLFPPGWLPFLRVLLRLLQRRRVVADTYFPVLTSISEDTFVLGLKRDWALELCKIVNADDTLTFSTVCILQLPAVHPRSQTDLSSFNRTSSSTMPTSTSMRPSALPFRSSPSDSLLSFSVSVRRSEKSLMEIKKMYFYALPSSLRTLAEAVAAQPPGKRRLKDRIHSRTSKWLRRDPPPSTPIVVSWDDWGPKTTRWIAPGGFSVRQSLSGTRCAISEWSGGTARVLDFNPGRVRRVVAVREPGKDGERVLQRLAVTSPSTIYAGKSFLRDFQSSLPYYELKRSGSRGDLFMDDEFIVQIEHIGSPEPLGHAIMIHPVVGGDSGT